MARTGYQIHIGWDHRGYRHTLYPAPTPCHWGVLRARLTRDTLIGRDALSLWTGDVAAHSSVTVVAGLTSACRGLRYFRIVPLQRSHRFVGYIHQYRYMIVRPISRVHIHIRHSALDATARLGMATAIVFGTRVGAFIFTRGA